MPKSPQRQEFEELVAKGENVRDAAKKVGVHMATGYRWQQKIKVSKHAGSGGRDNRVQQVAIDGVDTTPNKLDIQEIRRLTINICKGFYQQIANRLLTAKKNDEQIKPGDLARLSNAFTRVHHDWRLAAGIDKLIDTGPSSVEITFGERGELTKDALCDVVIEKYKEAFDSTLGEQEQIVLDAPNNGKPADNGGA